MGQVRGSSLLLLSALLCCPCHGWPWSRPVLERPNQPPLEGSEEEHGVLQAEVVDALHAAFTESDLEPLQVPDGWPWDDHVPEPPNQPPLDGSEEEYSVFRAEVVDALHAAFAAPESDWTFETDIGDGINISHRFDPDGGCPWVRAEAILERCSLNRTSDYIIINPRPTEWSPGYSATNKEFRKLQVPNGSMSLNWHWEHDSPFLRNRAYWGLTGWQWSPSGASIEDFTVAFHGDEPAPPGLPTGTRTTEWALHRLSDDGNGGSKYEVLWFDDLHGVVPCRLTVPSQVLALRKEVAVYRRILPGPSAKLLVV